jgi:thiamine-phosphate pyrophosphorylase
MQQRHYNPGYKTGARMPRSHLVNANIHRAKEGARVLEDIARFILRDDVLFQQARDLRHSIKSSAPIYDVKEDLGGVSLKEDNVRCDLISTIQANALRIQEALRVLEEMTQVATDKQWMKTLRYQAYDLHAKFFNSAKKYLKQHLLEGLYLIIDTDVISYPLEKIIETINQSPVNIVQYRNKSASKKIVFENTQKIRQQLHPNKLLIINDHIDIALELADGIHLGQDDYPLSHIRNIIPDDFILGISCHHLEEARVAAQFDISYLAIGCLFETNSKQDIVPVSIHELQKVCDAVSVPVCAIGGINLHNLEQVLTANIKMAALISFVWETDQPLKTINEMHEKISVAPRLSRGLEKP